MKCQCTIVELASHETDITVYQKYKAMMPGKRKIWLEELRKNVDADDMSRYSSIQNILDQYDETVMPTGTT
jgi:hypothetical protein